MLTPRELLTAFLGVLLKEPGEPPTVLGDVTAETSLMISACSSSTGERKEASREVWLLELPLSD